MFYPPHTNVSTESLWDWENIPKFLEKKGLGSGGSVQRAAIMCGCLTKDPKVMANIPSGNKSAYNQEKYKFLLDADFAISNRCCSVMKKSPAHSFAKKTGRHPITAQMASESRLRTQQWLKNGCNGFQMKEPVSNPMSFWTEQDVLLYIKLNDLPIASVYGDIVFEDNEHHELSANTSIFDENRPLLKTTGCNRTGCMFCGFGCHLEKPREGRFARMKETHPKLYDYIMRPLENGGLNYKHIIDWINEYGHFNIEY